MESIHEKQKPRKTDISIPTIYKAICLRQKESHYCVTKPIMNPRTPLQNCIQGPLKMAD